MRRITHPIGIVMLAALLASSPALSGDGEDKAEFEGSVEVMYRDVSQDGSERRYEQDFDGLDSGLRLSSLETRWTGIGSGLLDFLHLEAGGLGGDPYEHASLRMGRKDRYDLRITHSSQAYLYNLFELLDDTDGSTWDTTRSRTGLDLTYHVTDGIELFAAYQDVDRSGTSLFLKDVNTDLFRLETPLDQKVKRYSLGGRFELGPVDLFFRQTLRRNDHFFRSTTENDAGLAAGDLPTLAAYEWIQDDDGSADLTTLKVSFPVGERVHVTASAFGTLFGEETTTSLVSLNAEGTSFRGTCSVSGSPCDNFSPCDPGIPGDVCVPDAFSVSDGTSSTDIEADHLLLEGDVAIRILDPLDFHLQFRSLDREIEATQLRDLDGNGVADDTEGTINDALPGSTVMTEYTLRSVTGLFDYAPSAKIRVRAGLRSISRDLERSGYEYGTNEYRNTEYESDGDDTLLLGLVYRPVSWLRLHADYEQGDIVQAFTAVSPMETDRLRVRARFQVRPEMRLDIGYLDYENTNSGVDFRDSGECSVAGSDIDLGCWGSRVKGTTHSASFWHRPGPNVDYWVRWASQDLDSMTRIRFDTDVLFNSAENGDSIYDNTSTEWSVRVNMKWENSWRAFLRARINDSDGDNIITGESFSNILILAQDYSDVEGGVTYMFQKGFYVGGRYRVFDYDDDDDRMDYDGTIVSILAGLNF